MSAESPNRPKFEAKSNRPKTVRPQNVTDPTILDSVAGFINEVVPTAYNAPQDSKDQIQWACFEQVDANVSACSPKYDCDKILPPPLILVLGYTTGIQVWAVPANGEATEIFSWRYGNARVLRLLPTPYVVGSVDKVDIFASKRPLIALCDTTAPGSQYCALNFLSLKSGDQVKLIKFKNPILDVLANRHSVVVTFAERIAIFDAFTLEDRSTVTTCYPSPGLQPNPIALGSSWLAYAEKKLDITKRSCGGNEGEGVQSYKAQVLHAAKSLGRGLRELGETVASSFTGNQISKPGHTSLHTHGQQDASQKGVVTILDIKTQIAKACGDKSNENESVVAHFTAHTEAIVCLQFDPSGLLLLTADKRGHDFHLFRIHPHPVGPTKAAVHHLYTLHRGDTSARVQQMCFSPDSRWVAVSTLRGTTHVFPITPYGGNVGVRTHCSPHVVNKMSRFHRSAGLSVEGRSSPVALSERPLSSNFPFHNPRYPPYPSSVVLQPHAQIRQPVYVQNLGNTSHTGRQRLSSSEENIALRVVACFAAPRAYIGDTAFREAASLKQQSRPVESLFVMSCHGALVQYDLEPHPSSAVPKERVCDDTPIDLSVCAKAQWVLQRQPTSVDVPLPLTFENLNFVAQNVPLYKKSKPDHSDDHWLSQVEILTHTGPHRRLWMGPQFTFKTYTTSSGSPMSMIECVPLNLNRSKPVNMPYTPGNAVMIESTSADSCEQSLLDTYHKTYQELGELQLKEDLADAMQDYSNVRDRGGHCVIVSVKQHGAAVTKVVNPLGTVITVKSDDETEMEVSEDDVIHENCDEALFRPVVASKPVLYSSHKPITCLDNIITKSLDSTTTVKVISKSQNKNINKRATPKATSRDCSPKSIKITPQASPKTKKKSVVKEAKVNAVCEVDSSCMSATHFKPIANFVAKSCEISDPFVDTITLAADIDESGISLRPKEINLDLPPLDNDDLLPTQTIPQPEKFEDARDCESFISNVDHSLKSHDRGVPDEITQEEKFLARKPRKPKAKLGVKLTSLNKENAPSNEKSFLDCSAEISIKPLKKTWSSVAAAKASQEEKPLTDSIENFNDNWDLSLQEREQFTFKLPKKSYSACVATKNLIDMDSFMVDDHFGETLEPTVLESQNLNKSSDEEKLDTGSSPAETTESDDSCKVPPETTASNAEDEVSIKTTTVGLKAPKKKLKKKRK